MDGELAVKCCIDAAAGGADVSGAVREYDSLQQIYQASINVGVTLLAPKPIGLLRDEGIVAMTWEAGDPMTANLLSGDLLTAHKCGAAAGNWLRQFHQLHPLVPQTSDFRDKLDSIVHALDQLWPRPDRLLHRANRQLGRYQAVAESVPLPGSWIFSDFKSDNLLMRAGEAVALDAQVQYKNAVIFDIAPFLIHLELLRWSPKGFLRWKLLTEAGNSFLAAYSAATAEWRLPISWLKTEMLLQRGIATAGATSLVERVRRSAIRRALAREVSNLESL